MPPTRSRPLRIALRFHAQDAKIRAPLTRHLQRFFASQGQRSIERMLLAIPAARWDQHTKDVYELPPAVPSAEEVLPDEERSRLWLALIPFLLQATLNAGNLAGLLVGLEIMVEHDPRVSDMLRREAGQRIAGMHRTTLDAVRATLAEGVQRGYSARQIAYGVPEDGFRGVRSTVTETYSGRAQTIARNEIAAARSNIVIERFREARIAEVMISDGADCGWSSHNSGDNANGTRRTLIAYQAQPFSHVNCVRQASPILER